MDPRLSEGCRLTSGIPVCVEYIRRMAGSRKPEAGRGRTNEISVGGSLGLEGSMLQSTMEIIKRGDAVLYFKTED